MTISEKRGSAESVLVSVIIPTFGRPELLLKAITSVLNQDHQHLEVIVVDDNHPDSNARVNTGRVALSIKDQRLRYVVHGQNKGANAARNTGVKNSKGAFICFLDDDDDYLSKKISSQIALIENDDIEKGILVFTAANIIGEKKTRTSYWMKGRSGPVTFENKTVLTDNYIGSNSFVLVDRNSFERVNGYDETLPSCQDWDLWIRLALSGVKIIGLPVPLVNYHERVALDRITSDKGKRLCGHKAIMDRYEAEVLTYENKLIARFYRYFYYQFLPINKGLAIEILRKQMKHLAGFKSVLLVAIDVIMLGIIHIPLLYNFARKVKHR